MLAVVRHLFGRDAMRSAIIVHPKHQRATAGVVGKGHQVFAQPFLVFGQPCFPVQFIDLMWHGVEAFLYGQ